MTTIREAVTRAYHRAGIVALGRDPKAAESEFGMETVQAMIDGWMEDGMFGRLTDVYKTVNYTAKEGERVIAPTAITVTKPTTISEDGDRAPWELAPIVTVLNGTQTNYVWTQGAWLTLTGLALASDLPFANYGRSGFEALIAMKLAETFGVALGASTIAEGRRFQGRIMFKSGQDRVPLEISDY